MPQPGERLATLARATLARARPYALPLLISALVGWLCVSRILERAGGLALPLDDSFIHLQYARSFAEGHFLRYTPGAAYSSGATSLLWPLLLAPATPLGETAPIVVAWLLGGLLHAAIALEVARYTAGLAGKSAGFAAGAIALGFGAFAWFAYSGMETLAFAWILICGLRVVAERLEGHRIWAAPNAAPPSDVQLALLGALAPLVRPEGILLSIVALVVTLIRPSETTGARGKGRRAPLRAALLGLLIVAGAIAIPASHLLHQGQAVSTTAHVKWLLLDPHLSRDQQIATFVANLRLLVTDLLAGGAWTGIFIPAYAVVVIVAGALAAIWLGRRQRRRARAWLLVGFVLATAVPCSYSTLLWNRVRYIWPFAPGWIVAAACLYGALGVLAGRRHQLAAMISPILGWATVATVGARLDAASQDLATSARAIERQQVALGRWARKHFPRLSLIGVNDTGAIAYFSHRRTFDVVGLTTAGEAPHWADGAGSRFEHYERLPQHQLPHYFIVYPQWMAMPPVLGVELHRASVFDQSILGGTTMVAHQARWDRLRTGHRPASLPEDASIVDALDIADRQSEAEHAYERGATASSWNVVEMVTLTDGRDVADGGRRERLDDHFTLTAPDGPSTLWLRVTSDSPLAVTVDGKDLPPPTERSRHGAWRELSVELPPGAGPRRIAIRRADGLSFASWHYWLVGATAP